jgi:hypothetical protein
LIVKISLSDTTDTYDMYIDKINSNVDNNCENKTSVMSYTSDRTDELPNNIKDFQILSLQLQNQKETPVS